LETHPDRRQPDPRSGLQRPSQAASPDRSNAPRTRRAYLDWLRGIAVLLMIEAHLLDSWTASPYRESAAYGRAIVAGGMGTTLFLMLAGVAAGLSAGSTLRRSGNAAAASTKVVRRGLEIFALAFLFRLQALILGWSSHAADVLKVDILNIMGPSIAAAALLWRLGSSVGRRGAIFAIAALVIAFGTPPIRSMRFDMLPDPLEAYIVPVAGLSNFVFFPWIGLVFAGAFVGVLLDDARTEEREKRLIVRLAAGGAAMATAALAGSYLPSPYDRSYFWTSSPAYFLLRVGLTTGAVAVAYVWNARVVRGRWSPVQQLGTTSLFIYWIHVEMVYGLISRPFHHALTLGQSWMAYGLFTALMLACSIAKDRVVTLAPALRLKRRVAG
jgi:uncharacterized membrane protein